jgi:hypothetical protein
MKKLVLLGLSLLGVSSAFSQQKYNLRTEHTKGQEIVCPASFVDKPSFVDMPAEVKAKLLNKNAKVGSGQAATFIVNYVNFPENAKTAFQRAVDIWAALLVSNVPIRVTAYWEDLGQNVLGAANTNNYYRNFPGAREVNTYYPLALAEKLAGRELNSINEDDIFCRFNSKIPWYYGTAPNVPLGTFDFTSIVLHELGHGLGFVSSMRVSGQQGFYGFGTKFNAIFDKFLQSGEGKNLIDTLAFKNPSNVLRNSLVSEDIFFVGPNTQSDVKENKALIYAPNPWESGSSISHLDDDKYGNGGINSLMTPTASLREKNLNPGPLVMKMFQDMGWKSTSIVHDALKNRALAGNIRFEANILSDTTLKANSTKLVYVLNDAASSQAKTVELQRDAVTGKYFANVNLPVNTTKVEYYFETKDNFGLTTTSPGNGGLEASNFIYSFEIGVKDVSGPGIEHYAPDILPSTSPVSLIANVTDDFQEGIDTVYVSYSVNGVVAPAVGLKKYRPGTDNSVFSQGRGDDVAYLAENAIKNLKIGDRVTYQVVAIDKSKNKTVLPTYYAGTNQNDKPAESFYSFMVTTLKSSTATEYVTDFETTNDDFALLGFNIAQPEGFSSKSLNTAHPYPNGLGLLDPVDGGIYMPFEKSDIAMLRTPIELKATNATITFDEVALVEPGDAGSVYGDQDFYDYVVVEGSLDGNFWFPLEDGYDSRAQGVWNTTFGSSFTSGTAGNSTAKASTAMVKRRTVQIYGSDFTSEFAGENLFIRFRMFADQWTNGWGWMIDNLYIQKDVPVILANESNNTPGLKISPNPTEETLKINLEVAESQNVKLEIFSLRGAKLVDEIVPTDGTMLDYEIAIGNLAPGTYMVKLTEKRGSVIKKFIKK